MEYFKYAIVGGTTLSAQTYTILQDYIWFAVSLYGMSNAEDAMDLTYFHVIRNYNPELGDLQAYVLSVLTTIYKNKIKDIPNDEVLQIELDKLDAKEDRNAHYFNEDLDDVSRESIEECKNLILPMYIKDYKFFQTYKESDKKMDYTRVLDLYSADVMSKAILEVKEDYDSMLDGLYNRNPYCNWKRYTWDKYKEFFDPALDFICTINNIVVCSRVPGVKVDNTKRAYSLNINFLVNNVLNTLKGKLMKKIGELEVWSTLSGYVTYNHEELHKVVENELICKLFSKESYLKIVAYEKGKVVYITTRTELNFIISYDFMGTKIRFDFDKVGLKVVD